MVDIEQLRRTVGQVEQIFTDVTDSNLKTTVVGTALFIAGLLLTVVGTVARYTGDPGRNSRPVATGTRSASSAA